MKPEALRQVRYYNDKMIIKMPKIIENIPPQKKLLGVGFLDLQNLGSKISVSSYIRNLAAHSRYLINRTPIITQIMPMYISNPSKIKYSLIGRL